VDTFNYTVAFWTSMVGALTMSLAVAAPIGIIVRALLIVTGSHA
jgi:hypothetical protein